MIVLRTVVLKVEERFRQEYVSGVGKDTRFRDVSLGWFIILDGDKPWTIHVGDKPKMRSGAAVRIAIEEET